MTRRIKLIETNDTFQEFAVECEGNGPFSFSVSVAAALLFYLIPSYFLGVHCKLHFNKKDDDKMGWTAKTMNREA